MKMFGRIVFRIILALVLVAAIAGLGFYAYRIGFTQGAVANLAASDGAARPAVPPMGYPGWGYPGWGFGFPFFGFLGFLAPLFLIFLVFAVIRAIFFRGFMMHRMGGGPFGWRHMHGMTPEDVEKAKAEWEKGGIPPMFATRLENWHRHAHEEKPTGAPQQ
jgi:hypothetical protein